MSQTDKGNDGQLASNADKKFLHKDTPSCQHFGEGMCSLQLSGLQTHGLGGLTRTYPAGGAVCSSILQTASPPLPPKPATLWSWLAVWPIRELDVWQQKIITSRRQQGAPRFIIFSLLFHSGKQSLQRTGKRCSKHRVQFFVFIR